MIYVCFVFDVDVIAGDHHAPWGGWEKVMESNISYFFFYSPPFPAPAPYISKLFLIFLNFKSKSIIPKKKQFHLEIFTDITFFSINTFPRAKVFIAQNDPTE